MTHKRQEIRQQIKSILDSVFTGPTDPTVFYNRPSRYEDDDMPVCQVMAKDEQSSLKSSDGDYDRIVTVLISLLGFSDTEAIDDKLDGFAERIEAAITPAAVTLARLATLKGSYFDPRPEGEEDYAILTLEYEIQYET